uniref:Uncharacterized protein n=1 Tax=Anguilla anguilla TaxID=7936 RepID=A0A0E9SVQ7_ANGAN
MLLRKLAICVFMYLFKIEIVGQLLLQENLVQL